MNTNRFTEEITSNSKRVERLMKEIRTLMLVDALIGDVDLSDISYHWIHEDDGEGLVRVELTLNEDKRDSKLAHVLARKLGVKFIKSQAWDKESLRLTAELAQTPDRPAFRISIDGAVPRTCQIKVTETPLTEEEIEAARKEALENVKLVKVTREIVCGRK